MDVGTCRSCKAPVLWARSARSGKPMPVELDNEKGNVIVDDQNRAHVLRNHEVAAAALEERDVIADTYMAHHATCPNRGDWTHAPQRQADDKHEQEAMF